MTSINVAPASDPANSGLMTSNRPVPLTRAVMPVNRHILFPVDFSQRSKELIPYVATIARKFNSEVTLLHVLGPHEGLPSESELIAPDWPRYRDLVRERRESDLMDFAAGTFDNVNVTAVVDSGDPAERIIHYAAEQDAGLIIMATHGRGTFRKLLLGSVTSKILHDSTYPVWTTAHAGTLAAGLPTRDIQKVICAIDTGSDGLRVLEATGDIASLFGAEVIIVHAVPVPTVGFEPGLDNGFGLFLADTAKDLIAKLQRNAGTKWEVSIDMGNVAAVIRDSALRNQADLVIIGRGCLSETLGGLRTHVGAIIRESPCPVLSVSNDSASA